MEFGFVTNIPSTEKRFKANGWRLVVLTCEIAPTHSRLSMAIQWDPPFPCITRKRDMVIRCCARVRKVVCWRYGLLGESSFRSA